MEPVDPTYFGAPADWRAWLAAHGADASELWLGFHKVGAATRGITYAQAVDEALCAGWIDGLRRRVDDERFTIRFTPRKPRSIWSAVNISRVGELEALGRMLPAGSAAFAARSEERSRVYSFEQQRAGLSAAFEERFRADEGAWRWFAAQPASYRKQASWWVMSAKREETQARRLATLIADSAAGRRLEYTTKWSVK
ncbi:MAG TPA: YdeI/OmpD-associated family protein [Ktedonobacterales bacterium]|nr:YdeI/OmpD-associated family protein [Ktedonobacterales bacterium]